MLAILYKHWRTTRHRVNDWLNRSVVWSQSHLTAVVSILNLHNAWELSDWSLTLRSTSLEKLRNTRKTLRNIGSRSNTTRVEGTKRKLRTRLTNGLCCHNTNSLANIHESARSQGPAVALCANAALRFASKHRTRLNFLNAMRNQVTQNVHRKRISTLCQNCSAIGRIENICSKQARVWTTVSSLNKRQIAVFVAISNFHHKTALSAAIFFTHDYFLRNVHKTTSQVARFCRTKCGICQTLTSAVLGDEVLQHGQTIAVV